MSSSLSSSSYFWRSDSGVRGRPDLALCQSKNPERGKEEPMKCLLVECARDRIGRKNSSGKAYVKILLLGQSESGKSTTLKNFQLKFAPKAFHADADSWRIVIYLNLLRSVNLIFDQLCPLPTRRPVASLEEAPARPNYCSLEVRRFKLRLLPLKAIEAMLSSVLEAEPYISSSPTPPSPTNTSKRDVFVFPISQPEPSKADANSTTTVTSQSNLPSSKWPLRCLSPRFFKKPVILQRSQSPPLESVADTSSSHTFATIVRVQSTTGWKDLARIQSANDVRYTKKGELETARQVLNACAQDVAAFWSSSEVQTSLRKCGVVLENHSGFFLNDVVRIAAMDYVPTDADILRARLSTVGIEEHLLRMEQGPDAGKDWKIYDCSGLRSQRAAWIRHFNDANVVIFLVPVSAFDQNLEEEPSVNRLQDSLQLWHQICSNRLLISRDLVIFFNKCDLLRDKLLAGIQFSQFVTSFDDKSNDYDAVVQHLRNLFTNIYQRYISNLKPSKGKLYTYLTSAVDAETTSDVLTLVQETILIRHLREASLV